MESRCRLKEVKAGQLRSVSLPFRLVIRSCVSPAISWALLVTYIRPRLPAQRIPPTKYTTSSTVKVNFSFFKKKKKKWTRESRGGESNYVLGIMGNDEPKGKDGSHFTSLSLISSSGFFFSFEKVKLYFSYFHIFTRNTKNVYVKILYVRRRAGWREIGREPSTELQVATCKRELSLPLRHKCGNGRALENSPNSD